MRRMRSAHRKRRPPSRASAMRRSLQQQGTRRAEPVFDLSTLPPLETITAETDIRAFLSPGVPAELRLAALRRAWVADPKVRDFVGLNDYDFDFHTPGAIPGFGSLEMTDELRQEVLRMFTGWQEQEPGAAEPRPPAVTAPDPEPTVSSVQPVAPAQEIAAQPSPPTRAVAVESDAEQNNAASDQDELIPPKQRGSATKIMLRRNKSIRNRKICRHLQGVGTAGLCPSNTIGHRAGLLTRERAPEQTPRVTLE